MSICELSGKKALYGNNVSHSQRKTRRSFKPNIISKYFKSDIMQEGCMMNVATSVIRQIEKAGGFDSYILSARDHSLSLKAQKIKRRIIKKKNQQNNVV